MPKLLLGLLLNSLFLIRYSLPVHAATDPIPATVSASARVPSASPTTGDTTAPLAVILVSPHDGATTNQSRPEFVWKQTQDPNSNYLTYTLYLNGQATYLGISSTGNSQQANYLARLGDGNLYLNPTLDLAPGVYDWFVRATDGSGNSSYSTTWRLTIDQTPPTLIVVNLDDLYHNPPITEGTSFDLPAKAATKLVFATEPYATVSITFTTSDGTVLSFSLPTPNSGIASLSVSLPLGITEVSASSFDSAGQTSTLPLFYLNLTPTATSGSISPLRLPPLTNLAMIPTNLTSLPATISQIQDQDLIALLPYILLAVAIIALLLLLWYRRYNILILDQASLRPYRSLILYHSRPTHSAKLKHLAGRLYLTSRDPVLYAIGSSGHAYIRALGRYSSLTLRTPDGRTHILSISRNQKQYCIAI